MVLSLSCIANELCTSCYRQNSCSRDGFVLNGRNMGISQLGFSYNGEKTLLSSRKLLSLKTIESSVNVVKQDSKEQHPFTVSYLIDSCGLSLEIAISASKKVKIMNSDNPDSVLAILRDYGFENTHIAKLVGKDPSVLLVRPGSNLIPKLEFLSSLGLREGRLAEFCSSSPYIFNYSLKNRIIPCCDFLKSVLVDDTKVASYLSFRLFQSGIQQRIVPNIEILREVGATVSVITYMLKSPARLLTMNSDKFGAGVKEVVKLGFEPSKFSFVQALNAIVLMSKSKWEKKMEVYKRWGCSDVHISSAFRRNPVCMLASEKKIQEVMDFLVNELGFEPADVMGNSNWFAYSLKKRLIPRCTVVRVLQLKGLLKNETSFATYMKFSETQFRQEFVEGYSEQAPELWSVYAGEMGLQELGFDPQEKHRIARL